MTAGSATTTQVLADAVVSAAPAATPAEPQTQSRRRGFNFRTRLVAGTCSLVLLTGAVVLYVSQRSAEATAQALANDLFREVSRHAVTRTRSFVLGAAPVVQTLLELDAGGALARNDSDRLASQLAGMLKANPGLSWIYYSDEAGNFTGVYHPAAGAIRTNQTHIGPDGKTKLVEYDVLPDGTWKLFRKDDDNGYDPRDRPYYQKAKKAGRLSWTSPYVFYTQGVPGISCSAPVYTNGKLRGVFTVDFTLNALSDFVAASIVSPHSTVFVFTSDRTLLAHPGKRLIKGSDRAKGELLTLADTGDPLVDAFSRNISDVDLHRLDAEAFEPFTFRESGKRYFASATGFRVGDDMQWVVGAIAPESDFLTGVRHSRNEAIIVCAIAVLAGLLLAFAMARRVSGPVVELISFMRRVGGGDLDARAQLGGGEDFHRLAEELNQMIGDLRDRLRIRHSLAVAMQIQQRLLPSGPPKVEGLDVAGHSTYCDETGGDYYDFLVLDRAGPGTLMMVVGDVMGHGVAAALVMAGIRAVLRDRSAEPGGLVTLLNRLNRLIEQDLRGSHFMTMHLSVVDLPNRVFRWASAGHDPAILYDPSADTFHEIDAGGLPLGVYDDGAYEEQSWGPLPAGLVIVIGTDGVWETRNAAGEEFGKDRLRAIIRRLAHSPSSEISAAIYNEVLQYRSQAEQTDDVTFVVVKVL